MNDLDLCLEVVSRSRQSLRDPYIFGSTVGYPSPSDSLASCSFILKIIDGTGNNGGLLVLNKKLDKQERGWQSSSLGA